MKKNLIALLMSAVLAVSGTGNITAFAAENQVSSESEQVLSGDDNSDEEIVREQTSSNSTDELLDDQRVEDENNGEITTTDDPDENLSDKVENTEGSENASSSAELEVDEPFSEENMATEMQINEEPVETEATSMTYGAVSFAGGSGTESDPYKVSTAAQLDAVRNNMEAYYIQTADIDLSSVNNWVPIGKDYDHCFWGQYDGNGYTISNLKIKNDGSEYYIGLFGYAGPEIKNLNLKDVDIEIDLNLCSDSVKIGTIAGNAPIINCSARGTINITGYAGYGCDIGGLAGTAQGIEDSHSEIAISVDCTGDQELNIGGLAGECLHGDALKSYSKGSISVSGNQLYVGGIVGQIAWGSEVRNCVNYGDINTQNECTGSTIAGIVGALVDEKIENCVNFGKITGSAEAFAAGITRTDGISIHNCYDLGSIKGNAYSGRIYTSDAQEIIAEGNYAYEYATVNERLIDEGFTADGFDGMNMSAKDIRTNISDILDGCGCEWVEPHSNGKGFNLKVHGHCVINKEICFDYDDWTFTNWFGIPGYKIPLERYQEVYGDNFTKQIYKQEIKPWKGNCFGMAATAALFYMDKLPVANYTHDVATLTAGGYDELADYYGKAYVKLKRDSELTKLIERYQIWNNSVEWPDMFYDFRDTEFGTNITDAEYFERVLDLIEETDEPLMIIINWDDDDGERSGHALLVDTFRPPVKKTNGWVRLYLYDPNNPYFEYFNDRTPLSNYKQAENRYVDVNTQNGQWHMDAMVNGNGDSETSIGYENGVKQRNSEIDFASVSSFPLNFDNKASFLVKGDKTSIRYTCDNLEIFNDNNDLIFSISDGRVIYEDEIVIYDYHDIGITDDSNISITSGRLLLPKGTYTSCFNNGCVSYSSDGDYEGVATKGAVEVKNVESTKIEITSDTDSTANLVIEDNYDGFTSIETDIELGDDASVIELNEERLIINSNEEQSVDINVITENGEKDISDVPIDSQTTIPLIENEIATGSCGDSVNWSLSDNGTLTISGTGDMDDFGNSGAPWNDYADQIKSLIIEEGVTCVGSYAFSGCNSLSSVIIPEGVTAVSYRAFANCSGLQEVEIADSVRTFGANVFENCSNLQTVSLSESISYIPDKMFKGCTKLESITLPASVSRIFSNAFQSSGLISIDIPDTVTTIQSEAFYECTQLKSVRLPGNLSIIDYGLFSNCSSLEEVTVPTSVTKIYNLAFYECTSLKKVVFEGDAPDFSKYVAFLEHNDYYHFKGDDLTAYYPYDNETWTEDNKQNYGGNVTWSAFKGDISKYTISLSEESFTYSGEPQKPTVSVFNGDVPLLSGTDYVVTYLNNINAGEATVKIAGTGDYIGNAIKTFRITPKEITPTVTLSETSFNYTGDPITPSVTVTYNNKQLIEGTDYTLEYRNNNEVGTASVVITCIGNYLGSTTIDFTIEMAVSGTWQKDKVGWWYRWSDGSYPKSKFEIIDDQTYYFNASGYMVTGWQSIGGKWYYFNASGAMMTGWQKLGGVWYYMNSNGPMVTGWQSIGGVWYYFNSSGAMQTGWRQLGGVWYYMNSSGAMVTGWQSIGGKWYYFNASGAMMTGWQQIGDVWYYMNSSGAMVTGWLKLGNTWYYMNASGAMVTGRQQINGTWYTFSSSGAMQ